MGGNRGLPLRPHHVQAIYWLVHATVLIDRSLCLLYLPAFERPEKTLPVRELLTAAGFPAA
jgi:hypothetical protein